MKRTETLLGKFGNSNTQQEYLVMEIETTSSHQQNSKTTFNIQRSYQTFNGEKLEPVSAGKPTKFRVPSTNEIIEKVTWTH